MEVFQLKFIGQKNSGKSSLLYYSIYQKFFFNSIPYGITYDYITTCLHFNKKLFKFISFQFNTYTHLSSRRPSNCTIITFDCTNKKSFKTASQLSKKIPPPLFIVCTKSDLPNRKISYQQGQILSQTSKSPYLQTSSKTGKNINFLFQLISLLFQQMVDFPSLIPKLFLTISGIAVFTCLARPDFNLPLFVFAWLIWSQNQTVIFPQTERMKVILLMIITFIVDLIWLIYWGFSGDALEASWSKGVVHFVYLLSLLNFFLKGGTMGLVAITQKDNIKGSLPENLARMIPMERFGQ